MENLQLIIFYFSWLGPDRFTEKIAASLWQWFKNCLYQFSSWRKNSGSISAQSISNFQPRTYGPLRSHIKTILDKKTSFRKLDGVGIQQALFFENWFSGSSRTRNLGVVFCGSASWSDLFVFKLLIKYKF